MTLFLNNKFNVIHELEKEEDFDYKTQVINFIENYLESEISILHPDYLYLITSTENENINNDILQLFKNYLKKLKLNIKNLIKRGDFSIDKSLNKILQNYIHKINYLNTIFKIDKTIFFNLFHNTIISDQILVNFIETELLTLSCDINIDIKTLFTNIKIINENNNENYIWFLKLIGSIIKNNIPTIKENINNKLLYEIKLITIYITKIKKTYNFIGISSEHIIEPIIEVYIEKIKTLINIENNFDDFYFLVENFWKEITDVIIFKEKINTLKNDISIKIQKKIQEKDNKDPIKIIKLIVMLNDYKIVEEQIFLLFNNECIFNNINEFINCYIISDHIIVNKLILLLKYLKEKDVFIQNYHNQLIKRLLSTKTLITIENILCESLIQVFGVCEINKIKQCIKDYITSSEDLNKYGASNFTTTLITTSYEAWNINYNNGFLDKFNIDINYQNGLLNFIQKYNKFYKTINDKKKLLWLLQYGEVEVEYNNYTLKMLPIQLFILELFNFNDSLNINDILNNKLFVNYHNEYIKQIIFSIVDSGLLCINNNILTLTPNVNNTNLIISYYNIKTDNIVLDINYDIIHSRKDITTTWINHLLKKGEKTFDELFCIISSEIKLFPMDKNILENALEYMIKQDYIRKENEYYIKIYY